MMDNLAWVEDLTCFRNLFSFLFVLPLFPWDVEVNTDLLIAVSDNDPNGKNSGLYLPHGLPLADASHLQI